LRRDYIQNQTHTEFSTSVKASTSIFLCEYFYVYFSLSEEKSALFPLLRYSTNKLQGCGPAFSVLTEDVRMRVVSLTRLEILYKMSTRLCK